MAIVHILEIQEILAERGAEDARSDSKHGFFVEIRFDDPGKPPKDTDEALRNRVITADCPYGSVTIQFDEYGQLRSIDLS